MDSHNTPSQPVNAIIAGHSTIAVSDPCRDAGAPPSPSRPRRRRRRWVIALACLLVLMAIPACGYFYLGWQQDRELAAVLAELDRTDPHWRFADMVAQRPDVPAAENPALVVMKVDALLRPGGYAIAPKYDPLFEQPTPSQHRPSGLQIVALRESFTKHGEALKLARTLKDFPGEGRYPIKVAPDFISTSLDPLQRCRSVMWMLQNDVMLRAEDDDAVGAMESCRACLVAARSIGLEPYLIAALIRHAGQGIAVNALERTLAQTEPPAVELAAMQELLAREIEAPVLLEAMRGERAGDDELMSVLKDGKVKLSTLMGGPGRGAGTWQEWLIDYLPGIVSAGRPEFLRLMTRHVEATRLPPEKQAPVFAELELLAKNSSSIYVRLLLPATAKVAQAHRRTQAQLRCAMAGVAAERYRIKHGQWPRALTDLIKEGLLPVVPTDPGDGRPLRYKVLPDGVLIYSVGIDGVDNGGALNRENPAAAGADIGFLLWDVPSRRQAPLPPRPRDE
jgi:hypothetical protein